MVNGMTTDVFWIIKCVENTVIFFYCNAKQDLPNQEILFFIIPPYYHFTCSKTAILASPQLHIISNSGINDWPRSDNEYSTLGGIWGYS